MDAFILYYCLSLWQFMGPKEHFLSPSYTRQVLFASWISPWRSACTMGGLGPQKSVILSLQKKIIHMFQDFFGLLGLLGFLALAFNHWIPKIEKISIFVWFSCTNYCLLLASTARLRQFFTATIFGIVSSPIKKGIHFLTTLLQHHSILGPLFLKAVFLGDTLSIYFLFTSILWS